MKETGWTDDLNQHSTFIQETEVCVPREAKSQCSIILKPQCVKMVSNSDISGQILDCSAHSLTPDSGLVGQKALRGQQKWHHPRVFQEYLATR